MSKKVIKSSNKNEKYDLKSVLDTDNIMSGVSLNTVTAIGCASVIASCGNKNNNGDKGNEDKNKLKWDDFKEYQAKFGNSKEDFDKFVSECKKQGISEEDIKKMIEQLNEQDVQNVLDGKKIKKENGEITIDGKVIKMKEPNPETNNTFSNFDKLSKEQKETLKEYGIKDQKTLDEFFNIEDNKGFKSKTISELFNAKDIRDDNLKNKLKEYKDSKQQPTSQVSEEKVKKLKELMQHKDDDYTIYNFYDNNIKTEEINKIYEQIKDRTLTPEDKDVSKNNSAKNLKDIIENKNNIKDVQLAIFKKIVDKLSKDKEYFEFSLDKKQFQINIKFTFKNEKGENKTETESKTYKTEDINIQEKIDIETHQIYTELSSLKEITKSSIDEAFNLENAKKDGKDIADGAGETKDLNAYLAVLKNNFDKLKELNNISNDAIKTKIHGQLLKNIQAKLTDFVNKKLSTQAKDKTPDTNAIVAAMKNTGICKQDANVKDADSMKKNPIDNKFFLSAIIGTGGFMNDAYTAMIDAMFNHFSNKHKVDNASKFIQNITDLKADYFTGDDANTKLKIDNNTCTYFEEVSAPDLTGYAKFKNVIDQINAIGNVPITATANDTFANSKTLADATDIAKVNAAFKAIHAVRTALDDVVNSTNDPNGIIKESELYKFLEKIVGKDKTDFKITYEKTAAATYDYDLSSEKYLSDGLLSIAVMVKKDYHKLAIGDLIGNGKILGDNAGTSVTGSFQLSLLRIVFTYMTTKSLHDGANGFNLGDCKNDNRAAAANEISLAADANNGLITNYYFTTELKRIQDKIGSETSDPAKVQAFVNVVKAMNIPEEIKYNGNAGAIKVEPNVDGGDNKFSNGTHTKRGQNIAYGDLGKYIIPILGISENSPHLIIGLLKTAVNIESLTTGTNALGSGDTQYAYDVTNNRICTKANANEVIKKNVDNKKYAVGVCINQ